MSQLELKEFEEIYRTQASRVRSILFSLGNQSEVDDLVQEVFIKIWKSYSSFEGKSSLSTWVYRITVNTAIDVSRKKKFWSFFDVFKGEEGVAKADSSTERDLVEKGLSKLSEDHRAVLVLSYLEGFSNSELADILDISEGTVKSRLHYAKKEFTETLKKAGVAYE